MKQHNSDMILAFSLWLILCDALTTHACVLVGIPEMNPINIFFINQIGLVATLFIGTALRVAFIVALHKVVPYLTDSQQLIILIVPLCYTLIVFNNLMNLMIVL